MILMRPQLPMEQCRKPMAEGFICCEDQWVGTRDEAIILDLDAKVICLNHGRFFVGWDELYETAKNMKDVH